MTNYRKFKKTRVMMATKAMHLLGDISRDREDYCYIYGRDGDDYIGRWVTGIGFFNVKFPVATTRFLTRNERRKAKKTNIYHSNGAVHTVI